MEVAYFTDLESNQLLEIWKNPWTEKEINVPQTRMGPSTVVMRAEGLTIPNPVGEAAGMFINHRFRPAIVEGDDVWITEEIKIDGPAMGPGPEFAYNEMSTYHASLSELSHDNTHVSSAVSFNGAVSWRPLDGFWRH